MNGGSVGLAITLDVDGARVVVVGGDDEAERKVELLLDGGARVRLLASAPTARLAAWAQAGTIEHHDRALHGEDLDGARLVLVALREPALAATVWAAARARGVLCWACDDPAHSDLAMPAVARLGAARAALSTAGRSPALAGRLRVALESALGASDGGQFARFVDVLGALRERTQREQTDPGRRRALLQAALDGFALTIAVRYPDWFK